ncbi:hypothetical protein JHK87_047519 [Glycine soja]|nr:hypothetical protein JHK87_047519 [Glycine soja]
MGDPAIRDKGSNMKKLWSLKMQRILHVIDRVMSLLDSDFHCKWKICLEPMLWLHCSDKRKPSLVSPTLSSLSQLLHSRFITFKCRTSAYVFLSVTNSPRRDSSFSLPLAANLAATVTVGVEKVVVNTSPSHHCCSLSMYVGLFFKVCVVPSTLVLPLWFPTVCLNCNLNILPIDKEGKEKKMRKEGRRKLETQVKLSLCMCLGSVTQYLRPHLFESFSFRRVHLSTMNPQGESWIPLLTIYLFAIFNY